MSGTGRRRCGRSTAIPGGTKPGSIPGKERGDRERGGEREGGGGGSEPPWEIQVYCQQRRVWPGSEPPRSRAAGQRQGTAGGTGTGWRGPGAAAVRDGRRRGGAPPAVTVPHRCGERHLRVALPFPEASSPEKGAGESGPAGAGREKGKVRGERACERGKGEEKEEEGSGLHLPARRGAPAALKPTAQFYSLPRRNKKVAIY